MNDGNSIDKTEALKPAAPIKGQMAGTSQSGIPDSRRRLLLRGAVGVAPLVVTLRSGALAASSCTGAKLLTATDASSQFTTPGGSTVVQSNLTCAIYTDTTGCPPGHISSGTSGGGAYTTVKVSDNPDGSTTWKCDTTPAGGAAFQNQPQVAILSANAASSLQL